MERIYRRNIFYQQISFKLKILSQLRLLSQRLVSNSGADAKVLISFIAICIVLLDTLMGVVVVHVGVWAFPEVWLQRAVTKYIFTSLNSTKEMLQWMTGAPAGLKLNVPLAEFMAFKLIAILQIWELFYTTFIKSYLTNIITILLTFKWLGLSVLLASAYDFLKFLNLCLICFYIFCSRLFWLKISALRSLARLFMGTKWNPLRHRVDSCGYDTSQLLLGTLFFTILLFLLPTTGLFAASFLVLRLLQFAVQCSFRVVIVLINKLLIKLVLLMEDLFTLPNIETLKFEFLNGCQCNRKKVVGLWNGERLPLKEVKKLVQKMSHLKRANKIITHSMLFWIDVAPF